MAESQDPQKGSDLALGVGRFHAQYGFDTFWSQFVGPQGDDVTHIGYLLLQVLESGSTGMLKKAAQRSIMVK